MRILWGMIQTENESDEVVIPLCALFICVAFSMLCITIYSAKTTSEIPAPAKVEKAEKAERGTQ